MRISPIPVDEEGLDVEAGMEIDSSARLAVITPASHFPTGAEMSPRRRSALVAWAERRGGWIFEDDYDSENKFDGLPPPPIAAAAPQSTIYLSSFNRMLFPSLRIAFMVLPEQMVETMADARSGLGGHSNVPNQMVMADFLAGGHLDGHLRRCRVAYQERQAALFDAVERHLSEHMTLKPRRSGLQAVGRLHALTEHEACRRAYAHGLEILGMRRFLETPTDQERVLLGFAGFPPDEIYSAAARLAEALSDESAVPGGPAMG
jgi:GntR family transcriptional regulator/MocR family aminotransferase